MASSMWVSHFSQSPVPQRQKTGNHYLLQVVVSRYAPLERLESRNRPLLRVLESGKDPPQWGSRRRPSGGGGSSSLSLLLAPLAFLFVCFSLDYVLFYIKDLIHT